MSLVTEEYTGLCAEPALIVPRPQATSNDRFVPRVDEWLEQIQGWPKLPTLIGVAVYLLVVAWLDMATGNSFPLAVLYVPAIAITCWRLSLVHAQMLSVLCAVLWIADDFISAEPLWPNWGTLWLAGSHLVFFLVVLNVLYRLHVVLAREQASAATDDLTGLGNTRWFMGQAELELERSRRQNRPLTVVFIDCDNFKHVNDTRGHREGDRLLSVVGSTIKSAVRVPDLVARIGGDEFAVLLPDVGRQHAELIVSRLQHLLDGAMRNEGWPDVTFSLGVATFEELPDTADDLIGAADAAMYVVKHGTKNGIHFRQGA